MDRNSEERKDEADSSMEIEEPLPEPKAGCSFWSASGGTSQHADSQTNDLEESSSEWDEFLVSSQLEEYRSPDEAVEDIWTNPYLLNQLSSDSDDECKEVPCEKTHVIAAEVCAAELREKRKRKLRKRYMKWKSLNSRFQLVNSEEPGLELLEILVKTPKEEKKSPAFDQWDVPQAFESENLTVKDEPENLPLAVGNESVPFTVGIENVRLTDDPENLQPAEDPESLIQTDDLGNLLETVNPENEPPAKKSIFKLPWKKSRKKRSSEATSTSKVQKEDAIEMEFLQHQAQYERDCKTFPIVSSSSEGSECYSNLLDFMDIDGMGTNVRNKLTTSQLETEEFDFGPVQRPKQTGFIKQFKDKKERRKRAKEVRKREMEEIKNWLEWSDKVVAIDSLQTMIKSFVAATKLFGIKPEQLARQINGKKLRKKRIVYLSDRHYYIGRLNRAQKRFENKFRKAMEVSRRNIVEYVDVLSMTEGDPVFDVVHHLTNDLLREVNKQRKMLANGAAKRMFRVKKIFYDSTIKLHAVEIEKCFCNMYVQGFLEKKTSSLCRLNEDYGYDFLQYDDSDDVEEVFF